MDNRIYDRVFEAFVSPQKMPSGATIVDLRSLAVGRAPKTARSGVNDFFDAWEFKNLDAWWENWWHLAERLAEEHIVPLLNAESGRCIFVPSVTHVLHQILSTPEMNKLGKRRVLTTDREFPTVYDVIHNQNHRYAHLPRSFKDPLSFQLHQVSMGDHGFDAQKIIDQIDDSTAAIVVPHVASFTGDLFDQNEIARIVHKADQHSALVVVDGSQAIGSVRIDVQQMKPHFYCGTLMKQGSGGMNGYLYIRPDVDLDPTHSGWVGTKEPFTHDDGQKRRTPSPSVLRRFYGVGTPQITPLYHATQGLEIFERVGYEEVVRDVRAKAMWMIQEFVAADMPLISDKNPENASALIVLKAENAVQMREDLKEKGVLVTGQERIVRLAPNIYHPVEDIRHATAEIISQFQYLLKGIHDHREKIPLRSL